MSVCCCPDLFLTLDVQTVAGLQIQQLQEALEKMKDGTKMALKAADEQRQQYHTEAQANLQATQESFQVFQPKICSSHEVHAILL